MSQWVSIMKNSRTGKEVSTMVHSIRKTSMIIGRHRIYAPSIQYLPSLMELLGNEMYKPPSSPIKINPVTIRSGMGCRVSPPEYIPKIKRGSGIFFLISLYFSCKFHVKSLQTGSKAYQYIFQNLM